MAYAGSSPLFRLCAAAAILLLEVSSAPVDTMSATEWVSKRSLAPLAHQWPRALGLAMCLMMYTAIFDGNGW